MVNIFDMAFPSGKKRKAFPIAVKRMEWLEASGNRKAKNEYKKTGKFDETVHSKCRECKKELRWGNGTYNFDHFDNNSANNRQSNCYLVCRNDHGGATKIEKRKVRGIGGIVLGHKSYKRKVGYKKPKSKKK